MGWKSGVAVAVLFVAALGTLTACTASQPLDESNDPEHPPTTGTDSLGLVDPTRWGRCTPDAAASASFHEAFAIFDNWVEIPVSAVEQSLSTDADGHVPIEQSGWTVLRGRLLPYTFHERGRGTLAEVPLSGATSIVVPVFEDNSPHFLAIAMFDDGRAVYIGPCDRERATLPLARFVESREAYETPARLVRDMIADRDHPAIFELRRAS